MTSSFFEYEKEHNELINQLKTGKWAGTVEAVINRKVSDVLTTSYI
jgi:hypothetical protein